jgi:hypothetical protein
MLCYVMYMRSSEVYSTLSGKTGKQNDDKRTGSKIVLRKSEKAVSEKNFAKNLEKMYIHLGSGTVHAKSSSQMKKNVFFSFI